MIDYNHKTLDDEADSIKVNAKVLTTEKSPVLQIYKRLDEIKNLQSVSVKEIFD